MNTTETRIDITTPEELLRHCEDATLRVKAAPKMFRQSVRLLMAAKRAAEVAAPVEMVRAFIRIHAQAKALMACEVGSGDDLDDEIIKDGRIDLCNVIDGTSVEMAQYHIMLGMLTLEQNRSLSEIFKSALKD